MRARSMTAASALSLAGLLAGLGCGAVRESGLSATPQATLSGRVHGGQQPVTGATVTLYAPGIAGYGGLPSVLTTTVTDGGGNFTFVRPYPCVAGSPVTYVVASGGNAGAGVNPLLAEAALLPACSSLTAATAIDITEVTTVAAAYALAPFASVSSTGTGIGTSATNVQGLANALGTASNLANTTTGNANAPMALPGMILPQAEMNTLADILAACVNTGVQANTAQTCSSLFTAATPPGGSAPIDTFQAAIDIALNPGNNVGSLYSLATPNAPFQPTLGTLPSDFALGIAYTGGTIGIGVGTSGIDIDSVGNAWLNVQGAGARSVTEISPSGQFLSGSSGFLTSGPLGLQGLAIDSSNNVYIVSAATNQVFELNAAGAQVSTSPFGAPSLNAPTGIAIDNRTGSIWLTDTNGFNGTTLTHMNMVGTELPGSPYGGLNAPLGVAIDNSGTVWAASAANMGSAGGNGFLTRYTLGSGGVYSASNFGAGTGVTLTPFDVAMDGSGSAWTTETRGVGKISSNGALLSPNGGYPLNAVTSPFSVILDGAGRAWTSNASQNSNSGYLGVPGSVTVFSNDGTLLSTSFIPTSGGNLLGYTANGILPQQPFAPDGLKVDGSGNLWVTGANASGTNVVTELIGIAAPVVTPVSVAVSTGRLATRP